jgi:ABC-type Na+ efflux pump permease subunit
MTGIDASRVRAVVRKELRDYRRKRSIVVTMAVLPLLFLLEPVIAIFLVPPATSGSALQERLTLPLLYLLLIPVIMPSTLAAYTVAGEREQGTLEPLLTTPIRRPEFVLGKAAAVMIPTMVLSYTVFWLFLAAVRLFASSVVASAVFHQGPVLLALFLFTPLLAGWAIVVGMAISVKASEVRVAQQLGMLASFPPVGLIVLLAIGVIHPTFVAAALFAAVLLLIDMRALRTVSRMFNRERLVTGLASIRRHSPPG